MKQYDVLWSKIQCFDQFYYFVSTVKYGGSTSIKIWFPSLIQMAGMRLSSYGYDFLYYFL